MLLFWRTVDDSKFKVSEITGVRFLFGDKKLAEQRSPFPYVHLEGCKAVESLKDCNAGVICFHCHRRCLLSIIFLCLSPEHISCKHRLSCSCRPSSGMFHTVPHQKNFHRGTTWQQNHCWWDLGRVANWQNRWEGALSQLVCSAWLKASWHVCSLCRLRKGSSVSPRSVNLLSQELSCVRPKRDSRENHVAKKEFLFWVIYIRSRLTCMVSKRSSACESPSVTVAWADCK